jgi:chromosomal replication initiator protein
MSTPQVSVLWPKTLAEIELKNILPSKVIETWIKPLTPLNIEGLSFTLGAPNEFFKNFVQDRYLAELSQAVYAVCQEELSLNIVSLKEQEDGDYRPEEAITAPGDKKNKKDAAPFDQDELFSTLNSKYSFESFVTGNSNRFAYSAALAVADSPAKSYNPLFIYGGVGLGKTHLMQAIGNKIRRNNPACRILYISSEKFTNEMVNSIRDGNPESFRQKYRYIDCLLIDDIQFLAGKERTQEEFFYTFNALYESNKQIVISSDRLPKEINTLEDRLRSRFEWGLTADIQPPDLETRIAILRKKVSSENISMPDDVITFIAGIIENNIRELEGAFLRVIAFTSIQNVPITMESSLQALKGFKDVKKPVTVEKIQEVVATHFKIKKEELLARKRLRNIVYPRQIAMYLCRELTDCSLPKTGELFSGQHYSTVIHSIEKIKKEIESNPSLKQEIKEIIRKIKTT